MLTVLCLAPIAAAAFFSARYMDGRGDTRPVFLTVGFIVGLLASLILAGAIDAYFGGALDRSKFVSQAGLQGSVLGILFANFLRRTGTTATSQEQVHLSRLPVVPPAITLQQPQPDRQQRATSKVGLTIRDLSRLMLVFSALLVLVGALSIHRYADGRSFAWNVINARICFTLEPVSFDSFENVTTNALRCGQFVYFTLVLKLAAAMAALAAVLRILRKQK